MGTAKQVLGSFGEVEVCRNIACPSCKRSRSLKPLPVNFKCADLICDFCGYLCQVKTASVAAIDKVPDQVLGAAWGVQKERMESGIFFRCFWCW